MASVAVARRHDLTDAQLAVCAAALPAASMQGQAAQVDQTAAQAGRPLAVHYRPLARARPGPIVVLRDGWCGPPQGTSSEIVSATQAGLSPPSRSTVTRTVASAPCEVVRSSRSSAPARSREPTGTGEGSRTLSLP